MTPRETLASPPSSAPFGTPAVVHPHTILVPLPTWQDLIDYALRTPEHMVKVTIGYSRAFVHKSIRRLVELCLQVVAKSDVKMCPDPVSMVFPTARILNESVSFLTRKRPADFCSDIQAINFNISGPDGSRPDSLHLVICPKELEKEVKSFWVTAGTGISGRHAEYILRRLELGATLQITQAPCESLLNISLVALEEKWTIRKRIADLLNGGDGNGSSLFYPAEQLVPGMRREV